MANLVFTYRDYSDETSSVSIQIPGITSANFDEILGDGALEGRGILRAAIDGVTNGLRVRESAVAVGEVFAGVVTEPTAQRENGLRVWGRGDSSGKLFSITIPTADETLLAVAGTDDVPLDGTEMAALVSALETYWKADYGAALEDITVTRARLVGRAN